MPEEVYFQKRKPVSTRTGLPLKSWTPNTAWRGIVRFPEGRTREFYGPTKQSVREKYKEWEASGGRAGETKVGAGRYQPKTGAGLSSTTLKDKSATQWLQEWVSDTRARAEHWDQRRAADANYWVRKYIAPPWTSVRLLDVTEEKVSELLDTLSDRPTTQSNVRRFLHRAFNDPAVLGLLKTNPVPRQSLRSQKKEEQKPETFRVLANEEWRNLVSVCRESQDPLATAILVTLECGLRSSETRALQYGDYANGELKIEKAVVRTTTVTPTEPTTTKIIFQLADVTKSKKSNRTIPVSPICREVMEALKTPMTYEEEYDDHGNRALLERPAPKPPAWQLIWSVSKGPNEGGPLDQSRLSKVLDVLREKAKIPEFACPRGHAPNALVMRQITNRAGDQIEAPFCDECGLQGVPLRVHDLRHTHCTALVMAGVPETVIMDRMGWSTRAMLAKYAHKTPGSEKLAVDALSHIHDPPPTERK